MYIDNELRLLRKYCSFSSPKCQIRSTNGDLIENICVPTHPRFPKKLTINHCRLIYLLTYLHIYLFIFNLKLN